MKKEYMTRKVTLNADSLTEALAATVADTVSLAKGKSATAYGVTLALSGSIADANMRHALFPDGDGGKAKTITGAEYAEAAALALEDLLDLPEGMELSGGTLMSRSTALGHSALIILDTAKLLFGRDEDEENSEENEENSEEAESNAD